MNDFLNLIILSILNLYINIIIKRPAKELMFVPDRC